MKRECYDTLLRNKKAAGIVMGAANIPVSKYIPATAAGRLLEGVLRDHAAVTRNSAISRGLMKLRQRNAIKIVDTSLMNRCEPATAAWKAFQELLEGIDASIDNAAS